VILISVANHIPFRVLLCAAFAAIGLAGVPAVKRANAQTSARQRDLLDTQESGPVFRDLAARININHRLKIVAFGSSSTEGIGASSPAHAYPALLQSDLQQLLPGGVSVIVINRGIGGQDADDMMARLATAVLAEKPDLVIWQTGTNDPLRNVPLSRFEAETRDGIQQMRAAGIEVILMEPQDCRLMRGMASAAAYRNMLRAIGKELGVPVIKRYDLIKGWLAEAKVTEAQLMAPDGLHMADEGYARLAAEVAREIIADTGITAKSITAAAVLH
jgi:acyl-CoA thioesterase I